MEGIVTLEDLLEEIVGEIEDEFDLPDETVERVDDDTDPHRRHVLDRRLQRGVRRRAAERGLPHDRRLRLRRARPRRRAGRRGRARRAASSRSTRVEGQRIDRLTVTFQPWHRREQGAAGDEQPAETRAAVLPAVSDTEGARHLSRLPGFAGQSFLLPPGALGHRPERGLEDPEPARPLEHEDAHLGHVLGGHHPRQHVRCAPAPRLEREVGRDSPGADVRAADPLLAQLVVERAREADLPELRRAVDRLVGSPRRPASEASVTTSPSVRPCAAAPRGSRTACPSG